MKRCEMKPPPFIPFFLRVTGILSNLYTSNIFTSMEEKNRIGFYSVAFCKVDPTNPIVGFSGSMHSLGGN